uniref:Uncharacterized protein n=1 Tax=Globodera rostochiensis TaxID=31243 RepID=A0A914HLV9_GLORO
MEEFWILILISFFATNSLDKAESVKLEKLEELRLQTFDELFVDEWWDKDEAEDLKMPAPPTNFGQNVHHQIDRQNTQIGQIEPNSTDQNPPLTESGHSENGKNCEEMTSNEKCKIMSDNFNEFGLSRKVFYEEERKHLVEKFDQMKAELMRAGFKNSYHELDKTVAKELGLSFVTIYNWKSELGQTKPRHNHSKQKELMKRYYEIKDKNSIKDEDIAKMLKIGARTLKNLLTDCPLTDCPLTDCPSLTDCPLTDWALTDCPLTDCPSFHKEATAFCRSDAVRIEKRGRRHHKIRRQDPKVSLCIVSLVNNRLKINRFHRDNNNNKTTKTICRKSAWFCEENMFKCICHQM